MLKVEISNTPDKLYQGLMFRKSLPENDGMIFQFSSPKELNFWGFNTYIPLDIAFINNENEIIKISHISPLSEKIVSSEKDCVVAIEANYGYFSKNKIYPGCKIKFEPLTENIGKVVFVR